VHRILCEGPEDLVALRELAIHLFGATTVPTRGGGAGGMTREQRLQGTTALVKLTVAKDAKSGLVREAMTALDAEPRRNRRDPNDQPLRRLGIVFDPDGDPRAKFENAVLTAFQTSAKEWRVRRLTSKRACLLATRDRDRVLVHFVAWRSTYALDTMPDVLNLERLLCEIAAEAYPAEASIVARWLKDFPVGSLQHPWKAALHLWCALVEAKSDEHSAPARFLHQNKTCAPHVEPLLRSISVLRELEPLLR